MRRYNLRCTYCHTDHYTSYFFIMLQLLIKGEVNVKCRNCGYMSSYILVSHIVHNTLSVEEKEYNKDINARKEEVWKNG